MYNNNFPFMPDFNNMNPFNKINELEQSVNRLEREVRRLNTRVNRLENNNNNSTKPFVSTTYQNTNNYNYDDEAGMYMM